LTLESLGESFTDLFELEEVLLQFGHRLDGSVGEPDLLRR
jgi:hypothetical protein